MQQVFRSDEADTFAIGSAQPIQNVASPTVTALMRTYKATVRRLDEVKAMSGPYAIVEREMLQRRRSALAQRIQKLTERRRMAR